MKNNNLHNVTISIPEIYNENLNILKNKGIIPNRSAGIRSAVKNFLEKESANMELFGHKLENIEN